MDGNKYRHTHLRMDDGLRGQMGSAARDLFRALHKTELSAHMFGCDLDFVWIEKNPWMVTAGVDIKLIGDTVTVIEVAFYNEWTQRIAPLYLLYAESSDAIREGRFKICRYLTGDPGPNPPTFAEKYICDTGNWAELGEWQSKLREFWKDQPYR